LIFPRAATLFFAATSIKIEARRLRCGGASFLFDRRFVLMKKILPLAALTLLFAVGFTSVSAQTAPALTPTQTVREFYKALREKRFREAFMMSTYRPAVEGLSAEDLAELAPDFAATAQGIPEKMDVSDETIKGDAATVMVNLAAPDEPFVPKEMRLRRENGVWIIADEEESKVRQDGKNYFFRLRIETHEADAENTILLIFRAQSIYLTQAGRFGDLNALVAAKLIDSYVLDTAVTGYQFRVTANSDGRSYGAWAEPVRYNRTGKASFYIDQTGRLQREDNQGKPLSPKKK
jgi:hypothetical protein